MTPTVALAVAALRAATAHCPALTDQPPVTLRIEPVRDCAGHTRTLGCYRGGLRIELDPATPRRMVARVVAHETGHLCAVLTSGDWSESAANRFADRVVPR